MIWASILTGILSPIGKYFRDRQVISAAKVERKDELKKLSLETKLEGIRNSGQADIDLDVQARGIAGVMDDISFYLFLAPVPLVFIPQMQAHVMAGFGALEAMPQWYQITLGLMLAAVWGYRRLVQPVLLKLFGLPKQIK